MALRQSSRSTSPGSCEIDWSGVASVMHYDDVSFLMDKDRHVGDVDVDINISQFPAGDLKCKLEVDLITTPHSFNGKSTCANLEVLPGWRPVYDSRPNLLLQVQYHVEPSVSAPSRLLGRVKYDRGEMKLKETIKFKLNESIPNGHRLFVVYRIYSMICAVPTFSGSHSVRRSDPPATKPLLDKRLPGGSIDSGDGENTESPKKNGDLGHQPVPQQQPGHTPPLTPEGLPTPRSRPKNRADFEIAIICALGIESDAIEAFLEEDFEEESSYGKASGDDNSYTTGRIGRHAVVMAYPPKMGPRTSASVVASLRNSFPGIKVLFLVGICGAAPKGEEGREILLGDVIISDSIIETDFGRWYPDRFIRKANPEDSLGPARPEILSFLQKLKRASTREELKNKMRGYLENLRKETHLLDGADADRTNDHLYRSDYHHKHQDSYSCRTCNDCKAPNDPVCEAARTASCIQLGCSNKELITRGDKRDAHPIIHFGRFASSGAVMRSGVHRDEIVEKEKVIAFEMEGAGAWPVLPTLIIKSACDYADSHKDKNWQKYASATAAACARAVLNKWRTSQE